MFSLLTGSDHRNSFPVYGQEVTVIASQQSEADNHSSGSNKVSSIDCNYGFNKSSAECCMLA